MGGRKKRQVSGREQAMIWKSQGCDTGYYRERDMAEKKKKSSQKSRKAVGILFMILFVAAGGAAGYGLAAFADLSGAETGEFLLMMVGLIVSVYIGSFLQIVIHEGGHLIFGLLSGYRFCSFRVGSFMWLRKEGKFVFRRFSLAGTGGQCLMGPPDLTDGKVPYILYNLGGALMNLISAAVFFGIALLFRGNFAVLVFFAAAAAMGVLLALMNGIPLKLEMVNNDGQNIIDIGKSSQEMYSFWLQMKIAELQAEGVRLRDMPRDWFEVPDDEEMKGSMTSVRAVLASNRLMEEHRFRENAQLIDHILSLDSAVPGIYRVLLICDRVYCELTEEKSPEILEKWTAKDQQKVMKQMKNYLSVLRTQYAYALLAEDDCEKAGKLKELFEKNLRSYPYEADAQIEKELVEMAEEIWNAGKMETGDEWAVYFSENFWARKHRGKPGREIRINHDFRWGDEQFRLLALYLCEEGVVLDLCKSFSQEAFHEFKEKWKDSIENADKLTDRELEQIEAENPSEMDFDIEMQLDGILLFSCGSCGMGWSPEFLDQSDPEVRTFIKHYDLGEEKCWTVQRSSFALREDPDEARECGEEQRNVDSKKPSGQEILSVPEAPGYMELYLSQYRRPVPAADFTLKGAGQTVRFTHPVSGKEYEMVIGSVENKKTEDLAAGEDEITSRFRMPQWYTEITYTLDPEPAEGGLLIRSRLHGDDPVPLENQDNGSSCCTVIGGADGPTSIFLAGKFSNRKTDEKVIHTAYSSLYFQPTDVKEWEILFNVKKKDDLELQISLDETSGQGGKSSMDQIEEREE